MYPVIVKGSAPPRRSDAVQPVPERVTQLDVLKTQEPAFSTYQSEKYCGLWKLLSTDTCMLLGAAASRS